MAEPVSDEVFARTINQLGIATIDQIEAAARAQAEVSAGGQTCSLADILVQQGIVTQQLRENVEKKALATQQGGIKQLGPYKILKKLGEGGMGAVYLADDTNVGRKVALKVLPKKYSADQSFLSRFRREAKATGSLNHVNIVTAYMTGEDMGVHFYAMEYCDGEPLDAILKREKTLPWDKAIGFTMQVARGLKHAHESNLIHRDIKPANIFITKNGTAKILDLGLSKNIGDAEQSFNTQSGVALGTPHYISPEQARGDKAIDGRTDIYSLGASLYHLLTGQTPFQGSTAAMIMMKHITGQLPNPQDINEDIPDGVVLVIQRMMAKEPDDRYRDCDALLRDLELVIDGKSPGTHGLEEGKSSVAVRLKVPARKTAARSATKIQPKKAAPAEKRPPDSAAAVTAAPLTKKPLNLGLVIGGVAGAAALLLVGVLVFGAKKKDDAPKVVEKPQPTPIEQVATKPPVAAKTDVKPPDPIPPPTQNQDTSFGRADEAWIKSVAAKKPEEQVSLVLAKLKDLNPGYDGTLKHPPKYIDGNEVREIAFPPHSKLSDLSPLRALTRLRDFSCEENSELKDLRPLRGLKLGALGLKWTGVTDLSPVSDMPLYGVALDGCPIEDLSPLRGKKIKQLYMGVKHRSFEPLIGMPLETLFFSKPQDDDYSPLKSLPLMRIAGDKKIIVKNRDIFQAIKSLEEINGMPAAEFWAQNGGAAPATVVATPAKSTDANDGFVPLFNGKDLTGWTQIGGKGWSVQDGVLVGQSAFGIGWLMSDREFADFDFELEYKLSSGGNSGIFLRAWPDGAPTGANFAEVQLLDDTAPQNASLPDKVKNGSIFSRLTRSVAPQAKIDDWNQVAVKVLGNHVTVTINGARITDGEVSFDNRSTGRIGLQLYPPSGAQFRRIRVRELPVKTAVVQEAPRPEADGFVSLFNGKDLTGWEGDPAVWSVKDGAIVADAGVGEKSFHFLRRSALTLEDFELRVACRLESANDAVGNMGIVFRGAQNVNPAIKGYVMDHHSFYDSVPARDWNGSLVELAGRKALAQPGQKVIARNIGGKNELEAVGKTGATKDDIAATLKKDGWNELVVIAQGNHIIQKINGLVVVDFTDLNEALRSLSGLLALKIWHNKGPLRAQFKDIRFKKLGAEAKSIDLLELVDLSKDREKTTLTGANNWEKNAGVLSYKTDGKMGMVTAPVSLTAARDYEIEVGMSRGALTIFLPVNASSRCWVDFNPQPGVIAFSSRNAVRKKLCDWPKTAGANARVKAHVHFDADPKQSSVTVFVDGQQVALWTGALADSGIPYDYPLNFPGQMTASLMCFKDSFECSAWTMRVFDGEAKVLRDMAAEKVDDPARWAKAIDLLKLIDPAKDKLSGNWRIENGELVCEKVHASKIELPYQPAAEYDYRIEFTTDHACQINQFCSHGGKALSWIMGSFGNNFIALEMIKAMGANDPGNPTSTKRKMKAKQRYVSIVQIRKGAVRAFLDGEKMADYPTDYSELSIVNPKYPWWKLRDEKLLALDTDEAPTQFHSICASAENELVMVSLCAPTTPVLLAI